MDGVFICSECGTGFEKDDGSKMEDIDVLFVSDEMVCPTCGKKMKDEVSAAKQFVIEDLIEMDTRFEFRCLDCEHWILDDEAATEVDEKVCPVCGGRLIDLHPYEEVA